MENYKPSFTFVRNIDDKIVSRSMDGNYIFVLPIDLDSEDLQEKIFKHLLNGAIGQQETSMDTGGINVTLDQFEEIVLSFDGVTDRNVAKVIFEYLNKIRHYSFNDDGNVMILEEIGDNILDRPLVLQKWVYFYDHLITSTEHAASICNELYINLVDRLSNIPIDEKAAEIELTFEERELYREANFYLIGNTKLINNKRENTYKTLEDVELYLMSISDFLDHKDTFIAASKSAKSILEAGREASENDMKYALELTKSVDSLMPIESIKKASSLLIPNCLNVELTEEELS